MASGTFVFALDAHLFQATFGSVDFGLPLTVGRGRGFARLAVGRGGHALIETLECFLARAALSAGHDGFELDPAHTLQSPAVEGGDVPGPGFDVGGRLRKGHDLFASSVDHLWIPLRRLDKS